MADLQTTIRDLANRVNGLRPNLLPKAQSMLAARGPGPIMSRLRGLGLRSPLGAAAMGQPQRAADGIGLMDTRFNQVASGYRMTDGAARPARVDSSGFIFTE